MTPRLLKQKNVKTIIHEGIEYFDVADIKSNHPDLKVDIEKIIIFNGSKIIMAKYITGCTEFDEKIKGIFKKK